MFLKVEAFSADKRENISFETTLLSVWVMVNEITSAIIENDE